MTQEHKSAHSTPLEVHLKELSTVETLQASQTGLYSRDVKKKKQFTPLQIVAVGFNVTNSWASIATSLAVAVAAGGTVTLVYGVIVAFIAYAAVAISMAELASVYPTAGGQYHFTSLVAPKSIARVASYWCGLLSAFSWVALCTAVTVISAQLLLALPIQYVTDYTPEAWHYFMVYQALNVALLLYNLFLLKKTLWVHDLGFALTLTLFIIVTITCLALSSKQPSHFVWTQFTNSTGWNDGVCFLTGLVTPCLMYAGLDATLHLAEECAEPRKVVPRALMSTVSIGFVTAFVFTIAMCYSIVDLDTMLSTAMPIYELWRQATSSNAAATAFLITLFLITIFIITAMQQTASYLIMALGRDDALIFSSKLSQIHPTLDVPVWGLLVNAACVLITGCLYLASTAAFNALINSCIVLQMISFWIPCVMLVIRRRSGAVLPSNRAFKVPQWLGWTCNLIVIGFGLIELVFFCFPTALPVTGSSMNYTSAIIGVEGLFIVVNWYLYAKRHFQGPIIEQFDT